MRSTRLRRKKRRLRAVPAGWVGVAGMMQADGIHPTAEAQSQLLLRRSGRHSSPCFEAWPQLLSRPRLEPQMSRSARTLYAYRLIVPDEQYDMFACRENRLHLARHWN